MENKGLTVAGTDGCAGLEQAEQFFDGCCIVAAVAVWECEGRFDSVEQCITCEDALLCEDAYAARTVAGCFDDGKGVAFECYCFAIGYDCG